jgi:phosphate transport system substrate-binding protein
MTNQHTMNGVGSVNSPKRRILAGALALTLVAAACGSDDDTSSDTEAPAATEAEEESTEAETEGTDAAGGATELAGGSVFVTGSSTVEPISIRVGELASE